jgi:PadR family transcriptional regulator PadR
MHSIGGFMNVQLKKGIVEVCILACLRSGPSYGYKIISDISELIEISESTLYPILRRLEDQTLLTVKTMEFNGRLRKYYYITEKGKKRLNDFKEEWKEVISIYNFVMKGEKI